MIEKSILTVITDVFSHESHLFSTSDAEHEDFKSQTEVKNTLENQKQKKHNRPILKQNIRV